MTELILQMEQIEEYLYFLRPCFTKRGFRHGISYINGLIFSFKKTIKQITKNDLNYKHHSGIQRLLNSLRLNLKLLNDKYLVKLKYLFKGEITLIFDDSLVERDGKKIELAQTHFDHCSGSYIRGHQFFTAMLCAENIILPLFPKVFSVQSDSKIAMAKSLIKNVSNKIKLTNILFDSWYSDKKLIQIAKRCSKRVICGIKANRNISIEPKKQQKIRLFVDKSEIKNYYIDEKKYTTQVLSAKMKGIAIGTILISRQYFEDKDCWSNPFFLFSSEKNQTVSSIMRIYQLRWNIEVFHRDAKQNLGFHPYVRKRAAIVSHAIFCTLSYTILKLYMYYQNLDMTIGECISYIRESNFNNFVKEIVEIEDKKERITRFEEVFINKTAQV